MLDYWIKDGKIVEYDPPYRMVYHATKTDYMRALSRDIEQTLIKGVK